MLRCRLLFLCLVTLWAIGCEQKATPLKKPPAQQETPHPANGPSSSSAGGSGEGEHGQRPSPATPSPIEVPNPDPSDSKPPAQPSEPEPTPAQLNQKARILSEAESQAHIQKEIRNQPAEDKAPSGYKKPPQKLLDCLRVVEVPYKTPSGDVKYGKLIVNKDIASDVAASFEDLLNIDGFYMDKVGNMSEYQWSDDSSMKHNNTSCWNYRCRAGSSGKLSWHALGLAIDINPKYNPYVTSRGTLYPSNSPGYKPRKPGSAPGSYDHRAVTAQVVSTFKKRGFKWGGDWSGAKDYQHFELIPKGKSSVDSPGFDKFCGFNY